MQKGRESAPERSQGKAVRPPVGRTQPSRSTCSPTKVSSVARFCSATACAREMIVSRLRIAAAASASLIGELLIVR